MKLIEGFAKTTRGLREEIGDLREKAKTAEAAMKAMKENNEAEREEAELELQAAYDLATRTTTCFRIETLSNNDTAVRRFTFAPSWQEFCSLVEELRPCISSRTATGTLNLHNMIAMALMRLRFGCTLEFLAVMFFGKIESMQNVERIVHDMWVLIDGVLYDTTVRLLTAEEIANTCTPSDFAAALPDAVVVLDVTYQYLQSTWGTGTSCSWGLSFFFFFCFNSNLGAAELNQWIYCHYKGHSLLKFLIGCAPNGRILFLLGPIPGSVSDDTALLEYLSNDGDEGAAIKVWIQNLQRGAGFVVDSGAQTELYFTR